MSRNCCNFILSLIVNALLILNVQENVEAELILTTSTALTWGEWRPWEVCPEGTFVVAADTFSYKSKQTFNILLKDEMGLIEIVFECNDPRNPRAPTFIRTLVNGVTSEVNMTFNRDATTNFTIIQPSNSTRDGIDDVHITFGYPLKMSCQQVMTGFQINFEDEKQNADNTATDNLRIYCSELQHSKPKYLEGYGENRGQWMEPARCDRRQAVCGVQTFAHDFHKKETDYIGINNIRVKCCDIPNPALTCEPSDSLELIQECTNPDAVEPFPCHFKRQVGVGVSSMKDTIHLREYEFNENVGYSSPNQDDWSGVGVENEEEDGAVEEDSISNTNDYWLMSGLAENFANNLGESSVTEYDWSRKDVSIWNAETSESIKFNTGLGYTARIYQIVGHCSYFSVRTPLFKRVDEQT